MELPFNTVYSRHPWQSGRKSSSRLGYETGLGGICISEFQKQGYSVSSAYTVVKVNKVNFSYRDNLWKGADLLATGIASFGHASGVHYQNLADLDKYLSTIESGNLPLGRGFVPSSHQALVREMILLLKRGYLDASYFRDKFGVEILKEFSEQWQEYVSEGYVKLNGDLIELTNAGLLRVDALLPPFFEAEFQGVRYT